MTGASHPASETVLRVKDLTKTFGRRTVVDGVSFDVRRGEMFGFLGPNGSGKTTTIRMALGIIRPDADSIGILGAPPDRSVLRAVGYLPEERGLPRKLRVLDALRYGRSPHVAASIDAHTSFIDGASSATLLRCLMRLCTRTLLLSPALTYFLRCLPSSLISSASHSGARMSFP